MTRCGECGKPAHGDYVSTTIGAEYAWCVDCFGVFVNELEGVTA